MSDRAKEARGNRERMPLIAAEVDRLRLVFGEVKVLWAWEIGPDGIRREVGAPLVQSQAAP
jgi:hypothetical protein